MDKGGYDYTTGWAKSNLDIPFHFTEHEISQGDWEIKITGSTHQGIMFFLNMLRGYHLPAKWNSSELEPWGETIPDNWREILIERYPENFPEGLATKNFPALWSLLPKSLQEEILNK